MSPTETLSHTLYKKEDWIKFTEETEVVLKKCKNPHSPTHGKHNTHQLQADKHHIPKSKMQKACKLLSISEKDQTERHYTHQK